MIKKEELDKIVVREQVPLVNVYREYCQNVFLSFLYRQKVHGGMLFKGGTALRLVYRSPRYSEDLDFSLFRLDADQVEKVLLGTLSGLEESNLSPEIYESKGTSGGYLANIGLVVHDKKVKISIQGSRRNGRDLKPDVQLISNNFIPSYTAWLLPEEELVREKVSAALVRSKPRDFFDIYFLLRKGLIPVELRSELKNVSEKLAHEDISWRGELEDLVPRSMHALIKNFDKVLTSELDKFCR